MELYSPWIEQSFGRTELRCAFPYTSMVREEKNYKFMAMFTLLVKVNQESTAGFTDSNYFLFDCNKCCEK